MPYSTHRDQWLKTKAIDARSGNQYSLTLFDPTNRTRKIEVKCYGNILSEYAEHPEAKFLAYDGSPCDNMTRGLLRRSHIIEKRRRYIGKETSRRWEQGDDMSMVDFRCTEYVGDRVIASEEIRKRIIEIGIRKVARETGLHTDTVTLIAKGIPVKLVTLQRIINIIDG